MGPEGVFAGDLRDLSQRIDSAAIRSPGVGDHDERFKAGLAVPANQPGQFDAVQSVLGVGRNAAQLGWLESQEAQGAIDRGVRLIRKIHRGAFRIIVQQGTARHRKRREVGHRTATDEQTGRARENHGIVRRDAVQ